MKETVETKLYRDETDAEQSEVLHRKTDKEILEQVEGLLRSQKNKIGNGNIAEVHFSDLNEKICFKIIGTVDGKSTILVDTQKYHDLPKEAKFLDVLQDVHPDVRVPRPYYTVSRERISEETDEVEDMLSLMAMERLPAVSLRQVLEEGAILPDNFDIEIFFEQLRDFFNEMHSKGIHHMDPHEGNIMVDVRTAKPYVIDFGSSSYGNDEDVYRTEDARGRVTLHRSDTDNIDLVEKKTRIYLTENKK